MNKKVTKMPTEISILDYFDEIDANCWKAPKKLSSFINKLFSEYDYLCNREELLSLDWKLDNRSEFVLASIVYQKDDDNIENHDKNIRSIAKNILRYDGKLRQDKKDKDNFEGLIGDDVSKLRQMKFIEKAEETSFGNTKKSYYNHRLTLNGLFYVIINWYNEAFLNVSSKSLLHTILKYYGDSPLLTRFLYPYFENETLDKATFDLECDILEYLEDICKGIIRNKRKTSMIKKTLIEGTLPEDLFAWPSFESDKPDSGRRLIYKESIEKSRNLREFLSRELGEDWITNTQIIPDFDNDRLQIKNNISSRPAIIKINRKERSVKLVYGGKEYSSLRMSIDENDSISIIGKSAMSERELSEENLNDYCKLKLFELICSISIKNKGKSHDLYKSVEVDEKFKAVINEVIDLLRIS